MLHKKHAKDDLPDNELPYLAGRYVWVSQQPPADGEDEFAN
ncbi:hypothetical protein [Nocardioides sp. SYSU D00065]|nr:hypothetical protein [Nocardioides sp. SYSU D00065]